MKSVGSSRNLRTDLKRIRRECGSRATHIRASLPMQPACCAHRARRTGHQQACSLIVLVLGIPDFPFHWRGYPPGHRLIAGHTRGRRRLPAPATFHLQPRRLASRLEPAGDAPIIFGTGTNAPSRRPTSHGNPVRRGAVCFLPGHRVFIKFPAHRDPIAGRDASVLPRLGSTWLRNRKRLDLRHA